MTRSAPLLLLAFLLAFLPTGPTWAQQPSPDDSTEIESPRVDSLQGTLKRFETASPPTAADSARLRRWADSVHTKGDEMRGSDPAPARSLLEQVLNGYRALADSAGISEAIRDVGATHAVQSQYDKALVHFQEALEINRDIGDRNGIAKTLFSIGTVHLKVGRHDEALARFKESLKIRREIGDRNGIAKTINNIGIVQDNQGRYEEAMAHYEEALEIFQDIGNRRRIAGVLVNIGILHRQEGRYDDALVRFEKSLEIFREVGSQGGIARALGNIGNVHRREGRHDEALTRYQESLEISREVGSQRGISITLSNIGGVLAKQDREEEALVRFREALRISQEIGDWFSAALDLGNIGEVHYQKGRLAEARDTLGRSVRLLEKLRQNATSPEARRTLLSTQIENYRDLTRTHILSAQPDSAIRTVERARARVLSDQLAGTAKTDTSFTIPSVQKLRQTLAPNEAALLYANVRTDDWPLTVHSVTRDSVHTRLLPDSTVRAAVAEAHPTALNRLRRADGPLNAALSEKSASAEGSLPSLDEIIRLYRHHLTHSDADPAVRRDLGEQFHRLLLDPINEQIESKDELVIVPTGALGYLPFETLRDSTGQYLIERKKIRYAQSLTILHQLQNRNYTERENPLLALGGAAYEPEPALKGGPVLAEARRGSTRVATEEQASTLSQSAQRRMELGKSPKPTYARLGYRVWANLPETEEEVRQLGKIVGPGSSIITGKSASEDTVRVMNGTGQLSSYRHVHFATHGVAVPEAPTLSALVLSQMGASDSLASKDGYLNMQEISELDLRADVAVLSACQTGLGKVVAGEGVVSLSHAFLRAGANATLVSQWKVLDESTRQFMTAVYRRAQDENTSFAEAVTEVKRAFIGGEYGEENTDPLRWAPFVYYGRE